MGMANQPIISYALRGIRVAEMSTGECNGKQRKPMPALEMRMEEKV